MKTNHRVLAPLLEDIARRKHCQLVDIHAIHMKAWKLHRGDAENSYSVRLDLESPLLDAAVPTRVPQTASVKAGDDEPLPFGIILPDDGESIKEDEDATADKKKIVDDDASGDDSSIAANTDSDFGGSQSDRSSDSSGTAKKKLAKLSKKLAAIEPTKKKPVVPWLPKKPSFSELVPKPMPEPLVPSAMEKRIGSGRPVWIDGNLFVEMYRKHVHESYCVECSGCGGLKRLSFISQTGNELMSPLEARARLLRWQAACDGSQPSHTATKKLLVEFATDS